MYGICNICFEMIDLSMHRNEYIDNFVCKHCGNECFGIEVDEAILPTISELNKKGYYTKFCCSGHVMDGIRQTYDSRSVKNNFYIMFEERCEPKDFPNQLDVDIESYYGCKLIRKFFSTDLDYYRCYNLILDFNKNVYEWAKSLPSNKSQETFIRKVINKFKGE